MKPKVLLLILAAAVFAACKGAAAPKCPPGSKLMGEAPPEGSEVWCAKTVDGKEVKEGPIVIYRDNGAEMLRGEYHDGKQSGEWTQWYDDGTKASIDHYQDGLQNGEHIGWYTNGKISAKGQFKNGKREGVWKRWDQQGFRNWEETYKDDQKVQ